MLLLMLMLMLMLMVNSDADPQWSCFLYFVAKEAHELLLQVCDGDSLPRALKAQGTSRYRRWEWGVTVSHLFPSFPLAPPSHRMS